MVLLNQTLQLSLIATRLHPMAGEAVFWGLIFCYAALVLVPVHLFFRLPSSLVPPDSDQGPAFEAHLDRLRSRLEGNAHTRLLPMNDRGQVEAALKVLDAEAEGAIRKAGSRAFISTAVSQNGALDALMVLGIQSRVVWDVAHVYAQRPSAKDMLLLYSNVLATAFVAQEMEDVDLTGVTQPIFSTVLGSAVSVVPGFQVATSVFTNSVLSGTANAFLTLRVGIIAQEYSRALVRPEPSALRRSALARATGMLGGIATAGAGRVAAAVLDASKRSVTGAFTGVGRRMKTAGGAVVDRMSFRGGSDESVEDDAPEE